MWGKMLCCSYKLQDSLYRDDFMDLSIILEFSLFCWDLIEIISCPAILQLMYSLEQ